MEDEERIENIRECLQEAEYEADVLAQNTQFENLHCIIQDALVELENISDNIKNQETS